MSSVLVIHWVLFLLNHLLNDNHTLLSIFLSSHVKIDMNHWHQALYPWSCRNLDLQSSHPNTEAFILVPKMHQGWKFGEIQSSSLQDIALIKPKSAFSTVTLNFDLLTPKLEMFILVPKCTNVESPVKIRPILFKTLITRYGMYRLTNRQKTQCLGPHYVGGGIKSTNTTEVYVHMLKYMILIPWQQLTTTDLLKSYEERTLRHQVKSFSYSCTVQHVMHVSHLTRCDQVLLAQLKKSTMSTYIGALPNYWSHLH